MRTLSTLRTALLLLILPLVAACGGSGSPDAAKPKNAAKKGERVTVAVITNNPEAFWNICQAGAEKAAKEKDVELIFRRPEKGDVNAQTDIITSLLNQEISGMAVSVLNPTSQTPLLKQVAQRMNFITMDNDAPESSRLCYVGTENYGAGKAVGQLVKEAMPQGGKIVVFVGNMSSLNAQQRYQGVVDELAGQKDAKGPVFGKYTIHRNGPITDAGNRETAQDNANDAMEQVGKEPNVCFIGLYAYNPPAILKAAEAKGVVGKVKIIGFDEDAVTLKGIEDDKIFGTVVQDPFNYGYTSVCILAAEARGDTSLRTKSAVPHRVVTKTGVDPATGKKDRQVASEFAAELKKLLEGK